MIRRMIGYAAVLLLMIYLYFMYDDRVISGMLVLTVLCPAASAAFLIPVRGKVIPDLKRVPPVGEAGREIRAGITVENRSPFLALRYEVLILMGNSRDRKPGRRRCRGMVSGGGEETLWCGFQTELCGSVNVEIPEIRIYDPLGLFFLRRKCGSKAVVKIMPEFELMPVEITRRTREFQADAEVYSGERRGDDPSEIYQVRPYRAMDSLRDIHWKLSAKEEELMVKERSFPLGCAVLVWFDLRETDCTAEGFSDLVKRAAALSVTLAEEACIHMAAWYEEKNERIVKWRVDDEESAYDMIWHLLDVEPCRDIEKREICYEDTFRGMEFAAVVTIDGKGRMKKNGQEVELLRL